MKHLPNAFELVEKVIVEDAFELVEKETYKLINYEV